jgi:hypothetical protein
MVWPMLIGIGMSVAGSMMANNSAKAAARQNKKAAYMQADMMMKQAGVTEEQAKLKQADLAAQSGQLSSAQRASFAAQGVDLSSSAATMVQDQTAAMSQRDQDRLQFDAAMEAWGLRTQAKLTKKQGAVVAQSQINTANASTVAAIGSGAVQAYGAYSDSK